MSKRNKKRGEKVKWHKDTLVEILDRIENDIIGENPSIVREFG
jgi:CCR4-NOT transcriptional regulation complex NOT5 subunit